MSSYVFLTEEWVEAVHEIRSDMHERMPDVSVAVRINLVVTEVPFGEGAVDAHTDTSSGKLEMGLGHLEPSDVTLRVDYETARAHMVEGDAKKLMSAFLEGRLKIQGDMSKLLALQNARVGDPEVMEEFQSRMRSITS